MKSPVHTVKPQDSVARARALLADHRINQLLVVRDEGLVGIVTDRDLRDAPETLAIASQSLEAETAPVLPDATEIQVGDVMTVSLVTLSPQDNLQQAAQLMVNDRIGSIQ